MRCIGRSEQMALYDELKRGKSISQIHRETGYDRQTIRQVKRTGDAGLRADPSEIPVGRPHLLDPYKEYIRERVQEGCLNTAVLFDEIREQGYPGGRSILKDFVHPLRPLRIPEPVRRYETPPGRQAQCDWATLGTLRYPDGTERPLWVFILTLSYSRGVSMSNLSITGARIRSLRVSSTPSPILGPCRRRFCRTI